MKIVLGIVSGLVLLVILGWTFGHPPEPPGDAPTVD